MSVDVNKPIRPGQFLQIQTLSQFSGLVLVKAFGLQGFAGHPATMVPADSNRYREHIAVPSFFGTNNGTPVKEGVYFVRVIAKGADGREYNIKKDINLLRSYTEGTGTSSNP